MAFNDPIIKYQIKTANISGSTLADQGSAGLNAAINGSPTLATDTEAFVFNGSSDYLAVADNAALDTIKAMSIWFSTTQNGGTCALIGRDNGGSERAWQFRKNSSNKLEAICWPGVVFLTSSASINDGVLHNAVLDFNYDSGTNVTTVTMYIDGVQVDQDTLSGQGPPNVAYQMQIGAVIGGTAYFVGELAEPMLFAHNLSSTDAANIYAAGPPAAPPPPPPPPPPDNTIYIRDDFVTFSPEAMGTTPATIEGHASILAPVQISLMVTDTALTMTMKDFGGAGVATVKVSIDGGAYSSITTPASWGTVTLFTGLSDTEHRVDLRVTSGNGNLHFDTSMLVPKTTPVTRLVPELAGAYTSLGDSDFLATCQAGGIDIGGLGGGSIWWSAIRPDGRWRFKRQCSKMLLWVYGTALGAGIHLYTDGVLTHSTAFPSNETADGAGHWCLLGDSLDDTQEHDYIIIPNKHNSGAGPLFAGIMVSDDAGNSATTYPDLPVIVTFGDSILAGYTGATDRPRGASFQLQLLHLDDYLVINRAIDGTKIASADEPTNAGDTRTTDVTDYPGVVGAIILYGVNDLELGSTNLSNAQAALTSILTDFSGLDFVLACSLLNSSSFTSTVRDNWFNGYESTITGFGGNVTFIDMYHTINETDDLDDGLHPSYDHGVPKMVALFDAALPGAVVEITFGAPSIVSMSPSSATISWSAAEDGVSPYTYDAYLDGVLVTSNVSSPYVYTGLTPGTHYDFKVGVTDDDGNTTEGIVSRSTTCAQVTGVAITPGNTQLQVDWSAVTGASVYHVYLDGVLSDTGADTTATITSLTNDTTYSVVVKAQGTNGIEGTGSAAQNGTPTVPLVVNDPILYYDFDTAHVSGSTVSNQGSATGNNLTLAFSPSVSGTGISGQCVTFNSGFQKGTTADSAPLDTIRSVSVFFKFSSTVAGIMVSRDNGTSDRVFQLTRNGSNDVQLDTFWGGSASLTAGGSYKDSQWHQAIVTFEYNGSSTTTIKLYVDGALKATGTNTGDVPASAVGLAVGNGLVDSTNTFLGSLDEVRAYARTLSSDEANYLYRATIPASSSSSTRHGLLAVRMRVLNFRADRTRS